MDLEYLDRLDRALAVHRGMDFFGGRSLMHWVEPRPAWLVDPELTFIKGLLWAIAPILLWLFR